MIEGARVSVRCNIRRAQCWIFGEVKAIMTVLPPTPRTLVQVDFRGDRTRFVLPEKPAGGGLCDAAKTRLAGSARHCGTTLKSSLARCRDASIRTSSA